MADNSILSDFQRRFLESFFNQDFSHNFFLTGGTALSEFYLKHRYSEDLDFFTTEKEALLNLQDKLSPVLKATKSSITASRKLGEFNEFYLADQAETIKIDFIKDIHVQFGNKKQLGNLIVDSLENIASNKVCAILGRTDIKDFIDLYFILKETNSDFDSILNMAKQKDSGLNEFYLAGTMLEVDNLNILPRMIKKIELPDLKKFFAALANELFDRVKPQQ